MKPPKKFKSKDSQHNNDRARARHHGQAASGNAPAQGPLPGPPHGQTGAPRGRAGRTEVGNLIYGRHAVTAALLNPRRAIERLYSTENAFRGLDGAAQERAKPKLELVDPAYFDRALPRDAVHQGLGLLASNLETPDLWDVLSTGADLILMLDGVSDPQNIGAIFRSAAAFGAAAIIMQDRKAPAQTGALVKAAAGAVEMVHDIRVTNLSRALEEAQEAGFQCIALAGGGDTTLAQALSGQKILLVLGAEGAGVRPLVQSHCQAVAHIPMHAQMESLNVSVASGIALAMARQQLGGFAA